MDYHYSKDSWPAYSTAAKASTPNSFIKNPGIEESKVQTQEVITFQCTNNTKTFEKTRKEKKKSRRN